MKNYISSSEPVFMEKEVMEVGKFCDEIGILLDRFSVGEIERLLITRNDCAEVVAVSLTDYINMHRLAHFAENYIDDIEIAKIIEERCHGAQVQ